MGSMVGDVIGGFNAFRKEQLADGDDARMTVVQFDSENPFEVTADAKKLANVNDLTPSTFVPRGSTPLLDATGSLIRLAEARVEKRKAAGKKSENILVVTFTDGEENASHHYTHAQIVSLVAAKEAEGWTFAFLGAGVDAYAESGAIGYSAGSVQAFAPDGQGSQVAFSSLSRATTSIRGKARRGEHIDGKDFFEGDKAAEADRLQRGAS